MRIIRIVFLLAMCATVAQAADAAPVSQPILDELVKCVGALVGVLASLALARLASWLKGKGIEADILREDQRQQMAARVALMVEEQAAAAAKAKVPVIVSGEQKLASAVSALVDRVPGISTEQAADLVQAALPRLSLGAAAALRSLRERKMPSQSPQA